MVLPEKKKNHTSPFRAVVLKRWFLCLSTTKGFSTLSLTSCCALFVREGWVSSQPTSKPTTRKSQGSAKKVVCALTLQQNAMRTLVLSKSFFYAF